MYGYVLAYRVANDIRYGWASPELTRFTGPVWRNALVVNSERAAEVNIRLNTAPQLLLAQLDSGEWQAYAEPKLHIPESSFGEPNSFGGLLPPAANPRDAALLAEAVLIAFSEQSAEAAGRAHFGAIDQANRRSNEYRTSRAQRESFWLMAIEGVMGDYKNGAVINRDSSYVAANVSIEEDVSLPVSPDGIQGKFLQKFKGTYIEPHKTFNTAVVMDVERATDENFDAYSIKGNGRFFYSRPVLNESGELEKDQEGWVDFEIEEPMFLSPNSGKMTISTSLASCEVIFNGFDDDTISCHEL